MSRHRRSKSVGCERRAVVWPRGSFLLATDFLATLYTRESRQKYPKKETKRVGDPESGKPRPECGCDRRAFKKWRHYRAGDKENRRDASRKEDDEDVIGLALRLAQKHQLHRRSRIITYAEWLEFARADANFTDEFAFAVFVVAQGLGASSLVDEAHLATDAVVDADDRRVRADLWALTLTVIALGCDRAAGPDAMARYFRCHIERICWLALLCDVEFAASITTALQQTRRASSKRHHDALVAPLRAFANLDALFEATTLDARETAYVASIVPQMLSQIIDAFLVRDDEGAAGDQVSVAVVARLVGRALQADVFRLDDFAPPTRGRASSFSVAVGGLNLESCTN